MSKLDELTEVGRFRQKVEALLSDLEAHGEKPKIYEAKRTVAQQREKVRTGVSKTMKSEHLPDATGKARAADVADENTAWQATRRFWLLVGASCEARGLGWGGLFGFNTAQKRNILRQIDALRALGWPQRHEIYKTVKLSWDPAHCQASSNWPPKL